jgi:putative zinc finger protein
MDCSAVKPRMEALVNGSLPAPDRALAEQHIAACEGCRLELELVRAIGSQEQSPGSAPPPDWTLDRIFGPETAQSQGQQSTPSLPALSPGGIPTPAATAAPSGVPPTSWESASNPFGDTPAPGSSAPSAPAMEPAAAKTTPNPNQDEPKTPAQESWDFEPADAKSGKPPEQSLFFAEEALTRRKNPEDKKASNFRVILWGAGGVIGAIVLALSSWFVLHMAPQTGDDSMAGAAAPEASSSVDGGGTAGSAPGDEGPATTAPVPPPAPTPAPAQDGAAASHSPPVSASSAGQPPLLPDAGRPSGAAPRTSAHQAQPPATSKPAAISQRPSDTSVRRAAPEASKPSTRAVKPPPEPIADETASMDPSDTMPGDAHGSGMDGAEPQQAVPDAPRYRTRNGTVIAPPLSHAAETPQQTTEPPASGKPSTEKAPPEISSPIERIHLATLAAAQQEDLAALRRLRGTWKSFMSKMGVGPDRARARREYADCLWAIQSLTARRGDQKDALAAYREYLLSAPAGGADSQSVSRLRQLEDALAEQH